MRWDESETHKFVKIYLSHSCLWNPEHEDYKQKFKRQIAYQNMVKDFLEATNIKLSITEVRNKIKNLRSTYNQELAKVKDRKSKLSWFMDFHKCIHNITKSLKNDPSFDYQQHPRDDTQWEGEDTGNVETLDDEFEDTKDPVHEDNYIFLVKSEPEEHLEHGHTGHTKSKKPYKSRKRKLKCHNSSSTDLSDQPLRSSMDSNGDQKEDEFDIYGKYIASQLREMGLPRALSVQLQIQNIVSEARLDSVKDEI